MTLTIGDRFAIVQLVERADNCASERDADGYAALFTEDGSMLGAMGTAIGCDALRQTVSRVWATEPAGTLHLTLNAAIDDSGDDPIVNSTMLLVQPGSPPQMVGVARIRQRIRRTNDEWLISERAITDS